MKALTHRLLRSTATATLLGTLACQSAAAAPGKVIDTFTWQSVSGEPAVLSDGVRHVVWQPADGHTTVLDTTTGTSRDLQPPAGFVLRAIGDGRLVWESRGGDGASPQGWPIVVGDLTTGQLSATTLRHAGDGPLCSGDAYYGGVAAIGSIGVVAHCEGKGGVGTISFDARTGLSKALPAPTLAGPVTIDWDSPTGLTAICEGLQTRPLIAERGPVIGPSDDRFAYAAPYAVSARWNKRAQKFLGGLALHQCGVKRVVTLKSSVVVGSVELDPRALSWRSGRPNDRPTAKLRQLSSGRQVEYRVARGLSLSRVVHTANQLWIAVEDSDPDQPESAMQIIRVKAPWSAAT